VEWIRLAQDWEGVGLLCTRDEPTGSRTNELGS
jgi:hypothetical protein